ncbi:HNH endonuclease signature motif containing protein [Modestobacter sp. NPDC049651]|uniref:HNH endonuclease n=1 Tax=unclassified Modestobacter TaxID=2643866 RepID=UPI0034091B29
MEAALLPQAGDLSATGLEKRAAELMAELDPVAAEERRAKAALAADVRVHPSPVEGRATLAVDLPADEAVIEYAFINDLAQAAKRDGDPRPIGVIRTEVYTAWFRRLRAEGTPEVCPHITVTADLSSLADRGDRPGEINGLLITAGHLRELLARVGALVLTAPEGGSLSFAITGPDGELLATVTAAELERLVRRGCPDHPNTECGCAVLGPPPETEAYQPTAKQRAFVTTRDRRCRFLTCGQRVGWADLDHVIAHSCGGRTDCTNLCCLCRSHHRLKTFAPGWRFTMTDDGTLTVTTPSGVTRTTRPPGMRVRAPDPPPPPEPEFGPPPVVPDPNDDPPPF